LKPMLMDAFEADIPVSSCAARFTVAGSEEQAGGTDRGDISSWSRSPMKRVFDCFCVLCSLPVALPVLLVTAIAVWLTSRGPILFRQSRVGRAGKPFTIFKFRTMPAVPSTHSRPAVTTASNQVLTSIGAFMRRWKLDESPQLFNVLRGDLSLVGPRPKLASHQLSPLFCRPGITGHATIVFAAEERALSSIPAAQLDGFYRDVVLPAKEALDRHYMSRATFVSDLKLICRTLIRKADVCELRRLHSSSTAGPVAGHRGRQPASSRLRLQVLRRDRYRCRWCTQAGDEITLEVCQTHADAPDVEGNITLCAYCSALTL